jgi:hypothetical protein
MSELSEKFWSTWHPTRFHLKDEVGRRACHELSHAQLDALAELGSTLKPHQRLKTVQSYTTSGGTHLYARLPDGREAHISLSGNVVILGPDLS